MSWQPIETAPKDGTKLLATDGCFQIVVCWGVYELQDEDSPHYKDGDAGWRSAWDHGPVDDLTDWQRLPGLPGRAP